jgi:predicted dehydrogenase
MIKIGFLGCGGFARRYHVPALLEAADARIAIICDPQPAPALRAVAEQAGAPLVADIDALLAPGACDAVIVSTPHTLHHRHAGAVLEAGRHVLVDKPFVMHAREAEELAALAAARGVVAGVAFNRRLDRGCLRAREIIRSGALGAVRLVETVQLGYEKAGWFLDPALGGGGPFTGRGSHMADLVPWLVGQPPRAVRGRVRAGAPGRSDHGGFIDVRFDGIECRITCVEEGWHMWDEARIFGDDGMIELRRPLGLAIGWQLTWQRERGTVIEEIAADDAPGGCTRDFVAAVRERRDPVCSFRDAATSVRIIAAAFVSAAEGERWIVP